MYSFMFGTFYSVLCVYAAAAAAKSRQLCPTLCDPIDRSPPGSGPWDAPGRNTGVGCHFLLQCIKVKSESEVAQCPTLRPHGLQPTRLLRPRDSPGKSTGAGCHCLLRCVHASYSIMSCANNDSFSTSFTILLTFIIFLALLRYLWASCSIIRRAAEILVSFLISKRKVSIFHHQIYCLL